MALALLKLALRVEAGPDFDSNVHRVDNAANEAAVASFLARAAVRGKLDWRAGGTALHLNLDLGGKLFFEPAARAQDMVVARFGGALTRVAGPVLLAARLDYHELAQWNECQSVAGPLACHRDFRLAAATLGATWRDGAPSLGLEIAGRSYEWWPDPDQSFLAAGAALNPALRLTSGAEHEHEWSLLGSGRFEWRRHQGPGGLGELDPINPIAPRRVDWVGTLGVTAAYLGRAYASVGWTLEADRSSNRGYSYLRQAIVVEAAVPLPARFTVGARAQLLYFWYGNLPPSQAVEDENRDQLLVDVVRDFAHGLSLRARYQLFVTAQGSTQQRGYERHLGTLELGWKIP